MDLGGSWTSCATATASSPPTTRCALPRHRQPRLRRLACDATITLVVTRLREAGPDGVLRIEPLYVGRSARTVSGAQFKALVVRDRHCAARGCHQRPSRCQAHHVVHWADGGTTDLDNLVLLCDAHHRALHDGTTLLTQDGRSIDHTGWTHPPPQQHLRAA